MLGLIGLLVGASTLAAFGAGKAFGGDTAQTMAYATLALSELALVFAIRSTSTAAWRLPFNRWLVAACAAASVFVAASIYLPAFQTAFETVTLDATQALVVVALALDPVCRRRGREGTRSSWPRSGQARSRSAKEAERAGAADVASEDTGRVASPRGRRGAGGPRRADRRSRARALRGSWCAAARFSWAGAAGYADLERREPARPDTVYLWFSMTKIATATAVVQLAERGRLGLDEPVTAYSPRADERAADHDPQPARARQRAPEPDPGPLGPPRVRAGPSLTRVRAQDPRARPPEETGRRCALLEPRLPRARRGRGRRRRRELRGLRAPQPARAARHGPHRLRLHRRARPARCDRLPVAPKRAHAAVPPDAPAWDRRADERPFPLVQPLLRRRRLVRRADRLGPGRGALSRPTRGRRREGALARGRSLDAAARDARSQARRRPRLVPPPRRPRPRSAATSSTSAEAAASST